MKRTRFEYKDGKYQPVLTEEHVLREIVERLWIEARIPVHRINCPVGGKVRPNMPGIPDLVGWIPAGCTSFFLWKSDPAIRRRAMPLFIEVKRPGGRKRPAQIRFIEQAKNDGCIAFFADSWKAVVDGFGANGIIIQ